VNQRAERLARHGLGIGIEQEKPASDLDARVPMAGSL